MISALGFRGAFFYIRIAMGQLIHLPAARLKRYRQLSQKKFRQSAHLCLVEGIRLVKEALESDWTVEGLVVSDDLLAKGTAADLLRLAELRRAPVFRASRRELDALADTVTAQGIVAAVSWKDHTLSDIFRDSRPLLAVALDGVSDPGNAGTIVRTCDWFGARCVLLDKGSVDVHNPKVLRGSMGGVFHLPVLDDVDLRTALVEMKKREVAVVAAVAEGGEDPARLDLPRRAVIVFGNEAHGISPELRSMAETLLTVPRYGRAESLNVAVACGVVLSAIRPR